MLNLKREANETELQYGWRLYTYVKNGHINWQELADLMNRDCRSDISEYRTESAYRKPLQSAQKYYDEIFSKMTTDQDILDNIETERRELERAKIQFRDERNAWNKQNYIAARVEQKLDYLGEELVNIGRCNFGVPELNVDIYRLSDNADTNLLIILSDLHLGLTYDNSWGKYDSDVAKERLAEYLNQILEIRVKHLVKNATVVLAGDMISGNIHKTIQVTNRENVIEQVKLAAEYIASFCHTLSSWFDSVNVYSVAGNHSRIDRKEEALKDERLDDLVTYIVKQTLSHITNIKFELDANIDNTIACLNICDNDYLLVHGDYDIFTDGGVMRLCSMYGKFPKGIIAGHRHTSAFMDINGVKILQSGSLCGSGDDYTVQKRLCGKPCQVVALCSKNGIDCIYPIEF